MAEQNTIPPSTETRLASIADALLGQLEGAVRGGPALDETIRNLAGAFVDVDQARMAHQAAHAGRPAPAQLDEVLTAAWNATQEAGCTTQAGDHVVAAIRKAAGQ